MDDAAELPPVCIVGAGAVGTALARRLAEQGGRVEAVVSRRAADAQALADRVGAPFAGSLSSGMASSVRIVLICVPDDAIESVAEALSAFDHPWDETVVAHTSGAHTASLLAPLSEWGALTLSVHPLQTFTAETSPAAFEDIVIGIEGDEQARGVGSTLARVLGGHPLQLSADDKVRYHCAAALASNGLVALLSVVRDLLATIEDGAPPALEVMAPLIEQTWANVKTGTPEDELTGPVARGDVETVEAHLDALSDTAPHMVSLYVALSAEMIRVAKRGGRLDVEKAEVLADRLQTALKGSTTGTDPPTLLH